MGVLVVEPVVPAQIVIGELEVIPQLVNDEVEDHSCCRSLQERTNDIYLCCSSNLGFLWRKSGCEYVYKSTGDCYYAHTWMGLRNTVRATITGGLSFLGGIIPSDPGIRKIVNLSPRSLLWLGAFLGGFANAISTITIIETRLGMLLQNMLKEWTLFRGKINGALKFLYDRIVAVEGHIVKIQEFRESVQSKLSELLSHKDHTSEEVRLLKEQLEAMKKQIADLQRNSEEMLRRTDKIKGD